MLDITKTKIERVEVITEHISLVRTDSELTGDCNCHSLETHLRDDDEIKGFLGGVLVAAADADREYRKVFDEATQAFESVTFRDFFPCVDSLDGTETLIRLVHPIGDNSWVGALWDNVKKFNSEFGLPLTKSMVKDILNGPKFKEQA